MRVGIISAGLVSSLGMDIKNAVAAARAGISRATELNYYVRAAGDNEPEPVCGHPVPFGANGFEGGARLTQLLASSLMDLGRQRPSSPRDPPSDWYLSLPDPNRVHTGFELMPDEETRADARERATEVKMTSLDIDKVQAMARVAAVIAEWRTEPTVRFVSTAGHAGVGEALNRALDDLARGYIPRALVCGVDSLVDEAALAWLNNCKRLKSSGTPTGLQPGEAGAVFTVEPVSECCDSTPSVVTCVALDREDNPLLDGGAPTGVGLAKLMRRVPAEASLWLITDQNGEEYRAQEWGIALVRLLRSKSQFAEAELWHPAISFGDTGAAAGAIGVCLGLQAFQRGYAPRDTFTVLSCSEGPLRSCISISKNGNDYHG